MLLILAGLHYIAWVIVVGLAVSGMDFGHGRPSTDTGSVVIRGALVALRFAFPILAFGVLLAGRWKLPKCLSYTLGVGFMAFVGLFFWPVITRVTGNTRVTVLNEDGTPLAGLHAAEGWGMAGFNDRGGSDVRTTDTAGTVHFPPREARGSAGMHLLRNIRVYAFGYVFDPMVSGPFAEILISLPPGYWLPATGETPEENLDHPYFPRPTRHPGEPPWLPYYIANHDAYHAGATIHGRASGIANDEDIVLKVRPAIADETLTIDRF